MLAKRLFYRVLKAILLALPSNTFLKALCKTSWFNRLSHKFLFAALFLTATLIRSTSFGFGFSRHMNCSCFQRHHEIIHYIRKTFVQKLLLLLPGLQLRLTFEQHCQLRLAHHPRPPALALRPLWHFGLATDLLTIRLALPVAAAPRQQVIRPHIRIIPRGIRIGRHRRRRPKLRRWRPGAMHKTRGSRAAAPQHRVICRCVATHKLEQYCCGW